MPLFLVAQGGEQIESVFQQRRFAAGKTADAFVYDLGQCAAIRKFDVVIGAAPQKSVRKVLFRIAGQHKQRAVVRIGVYADVAQFGDAEEKLLDLVEQIVREIARGFVNFVNQHD